MPKTPKSSSDALAHVLGLLEKMPLLDGHNDLPMLIDEDPVARGDVVTYRLDERKPDRETDIPRLREGRLSAQVWAAFVDSDTSRPARKTLEQIDLIHRMIERHPDVFAPALTPADILRARGEGKIASLIAVEGGVGLENSIAPLRIWNAVGVRLMTLCHNGTLDWVDSATDAPKNGGLSAFGHLVIRELNRLGMIVDLAHVSADVMRQVLAESTAPVVFSHSNARALCDHPRNVPDDVLDMVPANDGLVMATFIPQFLNEDVRRAFEAGGPVPDATLSHVADHIEYITAKVGPDRIGIGSDFYGGSVMPTGLRDVSCFPALLAEMSLRGWSDDNLAKLAGLNFIRVFEAVEREGARLRGLHSAPVGSVETVDLSGR